MLNEDKGKNVEYENYYDNTFKNFGSGDVVKGKVIDIRENDVFIDIGYKSEGVINIKEFTDENGNISVNIGDEIEALFFNKTDRDGFEILSKSAADRIKSWRKIVNAYKENMSVTGTVKSLVNGGFIVDIDGFLAFLPGSQVEIKPIRNYSSYVGKQFEFKIVNINESKKNAVLSRKVLLEELRKKQEKEMWERIKEGVVLTGTVKNITDYGIFVDLGGIDGLVHITDMSWSRIGHPSDMVKTGDTIDVKVLKVEDGERQKKVYLGMKQLTEDPWENISEKFHIGDQVKGNIVNIVEYGLFIEIEKGIEGLVHKSEITYDKYPLRIKKLYNIGDSVDVKIINIDAENRRMSLSIKQCKPYPWENVEEKYKNGDVVKGTITGIKEFGIFVKLDEGIEGLVHDKDISWDKEDKTQFNVGDEIEAKVLSVEKDKERIALGIKQMTKDPWEDVDKKYKLGDIVEAKIVSIKPFGAFVKIDKGLESLVPKSEFNNYEPQKGDFAKIRILRLDKDRKKLISSFVND